MSFEFPGRMERTRDEPEIERAKRVAAWYGHFQHMIQIAALAAAVQAPGIAHAGEIDQANMAQHTDTAPLLHEAPSTGKYQLASGQWIHIPMEADGFNRVTVLTSPDGGPVVRAVIVFQQNHLNGPEKLRGLSNEQKLAELGAVEHSHETVSAALKKLVKEGSITSVCAEGVIDSPDGNGAHGVNEMIADFSDPESFNTVTALMAAPYLPSLQGAATRYNTIIDRKGGPDAAGITEIRTKLDPIFKDMGERYPKILSSAGELAGQGEIDLCAGVDQKTHDRAHASDVQKILERPQEQRTAAEKELVRKVAFHDWEKSALELALKQKGPAVGIEIGGGHDFYEVTAEWNKEHPYEQIVTVVASAFQFVPLKKDGGKLLTTEELTE